jgi:RIO kinase 1
MSTIQDNVTIEEGQFDDAPEDATPPTPVDVRAEAGHRFIDEENALEWSSDSDEDELDEFDAEEDDMEAAAFDQLRAEDEDWEIAERGAFTLALQGS